MLGKEYLARAVCSSAQLLAIYLSLAIIFSQCCLKFFLSFFLAASASTTGLFGTTIVESCVTYLGTQQLCNVPTYTRTETVFKSPAFTSSTTTPLVTTTLLPFTQTISLTETTTLALTESTITDTFSSTSTIFSTIIDTSVVSLTVTSTEMVSSTTTIIVATTTIPTLTGFLPVIDTTATAYPNVLLRKREREFSHIRDFSVLKRNNQTFHDGLLGAQTQSIECIVSTEIYETFVTVFTAKTQTKTITPMPITATITILQASTSTLAPFVSLTLSFSTTLITTSTLTVTTTFTTTTTADSFTTSTTITSYAACATNNLLSSVDSSTPNIVDILGNAQTTEYFPDTATDCCVLCQEADTCLAFGYSSTGTCYVFFRDDPTCEATASTADQNGASLSYLWSSVPATLYTVGNGICGYLYDGGSVA